MSNICCLPGRAGGSPVRLLGGFKTIPLLHSLLPTTPIVLATGRVDQTALDLADAYPYVTLLPKPFTIGELKGLLEKAKVH